MYSLKKIHTRLILYLCFLLSIGFILFSCFANFTCKSSASSEKWSSEEIKRFNKRIAEYNRQINPDFGKDGKASYLNEEDELAGKEAFKKYGINTVLSHKISYERALKDFRYPLCRNITYEDQLPSASVVIIFHNEPWSLLIRTIYSVLNRSPEHLLKEVVLIDDFSDEEELGDFLSYYLTNFLAHEKVHLTRLPERSGLIRARLAGAEKATGDVLVFLDGHVEVVIGWLEPLMARIKEKRTAVVVPNVDMISQETFEYFPSSYDENLYIYGFEWDGWFAPMFMPEGRRKKGYNRIAPADTPTMPGGIFGIDRAYFWEVGSYDRDMEGWGGENLEMSFRIWQCGGSLEVIPCSFVGHVYRTFRPYKIPGNKDTFSYNTARFAHVWMDDYKRLYFLYDPTFENVSLVGDIQERLELRERLQCKSFEWYLKNVYPEKFILDENVINYGRVKLKSKNLCLDDMDLDQPFFLRVYTCNSVLTSSQFFSLTVNGKLRKEYVCANAKLVDEEKKIFKVEALKCDMNDEDMDQWIFTDTGKIKNVPTNLCLDGTNLESEQEVTLSECSEEKDQTWAFSNKKIE